MGQIPPSLGQSLPPPAPPAPLIECPRCGYDLSPLTPLWLSPDDTRRGVCSECGLDFLWSDLRDPARLRLAWFVEHPSRERSWKERISFLRRALVTWLRITVPWRFWTRIRLETAYSRWRLLLWIIVLLLPIQILWSTLMVAVRAKYLHQSLGGKWPAQWNSEYSRYFLDALLSPIGRVHYRSGQGLSCSLAAPSASTAIPLGISILMPVLLLLLARSRAASRIRPRHVLRAGVYGLAWTVLWYLGGAGRTLMALGQELIPKWPFPRLGLQSLAITLPPVRPLTSGPTLISLGTLASVTWALWIACWWWFALSRGFRLRHAWFIWLLLMTAAILFGMVIALADPRFVRMMTGN